MPPQSKNQLEFQPAPLAFVLTTEGKLECYALVHPRKPGVSTRRSSVLPVMSLERGGAGGAAREGSFAGVDRGGKGEKVGHER